MAVVELKGLRTQSRKQDVHKLQFQERGSSRVQGCKIDSYSDEGGVGVGGWSRWYKNKPLKAKSKMRLRQRQTEYERQKDRQTQRNKEAGMETQREIESATKICQWFGEAGRTLNAWRSVVWSQGQWKTMPTSGSRVRDWKSTLAGVIHYRG